VKQVVGDGKGITLWVLEIKQLQLYRLLERPLKIPKFTIYLCKSGKGSETYH
jgi:hypothetical protein